MTVFTKLGKDIFASVDGAGHPRQVDNHDAQVWATEVERMFAAFQAGGGIVFAGTAEANASLHYAPNQMAWVIGDPLPENNGIYRKVGVPGVGSWQRVGDLPYSFIRATNTGDGTANAIKATTSVPIPAADGGALITLLVLADNTQNGPTVSFNGSAPLTITDALGTPVSPGGLNAGVLLVGYKVGTTFRMILGPRGWSPLLRTISDGARRVLELYDWTGGQGAKPSTTGYLGAAGLTQDVNQAVDVRGPAGPSGPGTGDMLRSVYDPQGKEVEALFASDMATEAEAEGGAGSKLPSVLRVMQLLKAQHIMPAKVFGIVPGAATSQLSGFLDAVDASKNFGGKTLLLPSGVIRIDGQVLCDGPITIAGEGYSEAPLDSDASGNVGSPYVDSGGTIIVTDFNQSTAQSLFRVTHHGCRIRGIEVRNIQPAIGSGWTPDASAPWAIDIYRAPYALEGGNWTHVSDIMLRNTTYGIRSRGANAVMFNNIKGQPFILGLDLDMCFDTPRIKDVHFGWSFWTGNTVVNDYQRATTVALNLGRVDGPYVDNLFAFQCRKVVQLYESTIGPDAAHHGGSERGFFKSIYCDGAFIGIDAAGRFSAEVENFSFYGLKDSRGIYLEPTTTNSWLKVGNADFAACGFEAVRVDGERNFVQICTAGVRGYNQEKAGAPAFYAAQGANNILIVDSPIIDRDGVSSTSQGGHGAPLFLGATRGTMPVQDGLVETTRIFTGTLNANGEAIIAAAGLNTTVYGIPEGIEAVGSAWQALKFNFLDAATLKFTSTEGAAASGRPYRVTVRLNGVPF